MKRVEIPWIDAMSLQYLCGKVTLQGCVSQSSMPIVFQ
jgi:hypothetical protein